MKRNQLSFDPENWEKTRSTAHKAIDDAFDFFQQIDQKRCWQPPSAKMKKKFQARLPKESTPIESVYDATTITLKNKRMTPLFLLRTIRIAAGGTTAILYGHSVEHVTAIIGYNFLSMSYLVSLLIFYVILFLVRFHYVDPKTLISLSPGVKELHHVQMGLLVMNVLLSLYEMSEHTQTVTIEVVVKMLIMNVFIVFPDMLFNLLLKVLRGGV